MAFVKSIVKDERELKAQHPTTVDCHFIVGERDGRKIVQLNTYGSADREIPDKLSQTLQFSEDSAKALWKLLGETFGLKFEK